MIVAQFCDAFKFLLLGWGVPLELVLSSMGIGTIDNQREHCIIATISLLCSIVRVTMVQLEGVGRRLASQPTPHMARHVTL